jgi:glycogen debranching enzyme
MDNTPRPSVAQGAWVDESAQQALAAWALAQIAGALGLPARASQWTAEHDAVAALINQYLWHIVDGTYYDRTPAGTLTGVKHLGAYWTLLAGVADAGQAAQLAAHLRDPQEFYRPHLFPTLAADDPSYVASGQYWLGSVWAPTEYMVVKGLERAGIWDLAREAAESHLTHVAGVYASPPTDESLIAPEERDGDYRTIWECYGAEATVPATRWDGTYYSRQDFVGWSGLGPIAMLIEDVLGIQAEGASSRVTWSLARTDRHGVERLQLGPDNLVSLVAEARATPSSPAAITIQADQAFHLTVARPGLAAFDVDVAAGVSSVTAP